MSNSFVRWSVQFKLLVFAMAAGIIALGITFLPHSSLDSLPEFAAPHVEVQTEALGLSAVEVEQLITSPMEVDILNGVAYLDEIRSTSVPGLSSIELVFQPGTDLLRARQLVAERLTRARSLPKVSTAPVLMQPLSSTSRVMMVRLSSTAVPLLEMSVLARWNIKPRLMGVPGVANVSIWGQREQQMQVQVDQKVLQAKGLTLNQIIRTTGNAVWVSPLSFLEASTPGTGGFIETGNQRLGIQHILPITTPKELGQVSIEGVTGTPQVLGDVTTVVEDHQPLIGDTVSEKEPGLLLVIEKFPGANTLQVTAELEKVLDELKPGLSGVSVDSTVYRPASAIQAAVGSLALASMLSLVLAVVFLGLFFRSWRVGLVGFIAITVSVVGSALVLFALGVTLNALVFTGLVLALAVVVGDVVADLQELRHARWERGGSRGVQEQTRVTFIGAALRKTRNSIGIAALVMALAVTPAFFLESVDRALMVPLVLAFLLSIAVGTLVAWTLTPALAAALLRAEADRAPTAFAQRMRAGHLTAFRWVSRRSRPVIGATAALGLVALVAAPLLAVGDPMIPVLQNRTVLIRWDGIAGTSVQEMDRITARASSEIRTVPGVANVGADVGRATTGDQVVGVNSAEMWVTIDDHADYESAAKAVSDVVDGYPGMKSTVLTYSQDRVSAERNRIRTGFVVRVFGVDAGTLMAKAEEVKSMIAGIDGLSHARIDAPSEQPIAEIEVNLDAAQQAGILPGEVRRAAAALVQGVEVGFLFERQKVFQVVVKGVPSTGNSLTSVTDLLIDTPDGGQVRLGDIATVKIAPNQTEVRHVDTQRYLDVLADYSGRTPSDIEAEARAGIARISFPEEYNAQIPTPLVAQQGDPRLIWAVAIAALIGMMVLLQIAAGSWRVAGIILLGLPFALGGGVLASALTGGYNSLVSVLGFAAVLGIAVRDSIIAVKRTRKATASHASTGERPALRASRDGLVPTVATAVITAAMLLPFVALGGVMGREVFLPLAMVVWGGLVSSAVLTLFVLPPVLAAVGVQVRDDAVEPGTTLHPMAGS
ncbi:efflux RND transporter permease subunit [Cryobacterium tepidiphilum]|uniref:Efflux RND transporter permease subunit n=1 Tax=Cryobacterium tepidiphilum TaxID=2486026 RepID=A0A3M8LA42_9MICO|nr:efflux RND transporter permease subunit [Cryobacterium tepidiphilum]RNE62371.1 efflux RND transporter permease subunit [Cryobacterium tepidiphilum]